MSKERDSLHFQMSSTRIFPLGNLCIENTKNKSRVEPYFSYFKPKRMEMRTVYTKNLIQEFSSIANFAFSFSKISATNASLFLFLYAKLNASLAVGSTS